MTKRIKSEVVGYEHDERAVKRRKLPIDNNDETAESTTKLGLELLDSIKKIADENGRLIATDFLTLPSKRLLPEYYHVIKMPIALDTIETKLKSREFSNLTSLESFFKRMILNARDFNGKYSIIYEDAERIGKVVSNYMSKYNPAYKSLLDSTIISTLDSHGNDDKIIGDSIITKSREEQFSRKFSHISKDPKISRYVATPGVSDLKYSESNFEGNSFQQAQEKIVEYMIAEKEWEEDDFGAFEPFITLPSRKDYKDYYNVITHPVALKDLQKAVRGVRTKTPGTSEFKTWSAFEEEASYIWRNAFLYNEDNSHIFKLAVDLKQFFFQLLHKAKSVVPEPVSTKIKLRMPEPTKITLKISRKSSPIEHNSSQPVPQTVNNQPKTNDTASRNPSSNLSNAMPTNRQEQVRSLSKSLPSSVSLSAAPAENEEISQKSLVAQATDSNSNSNSNSNKSTKPIAMPPPTTTFSSNHTPSGYVQSFVHQSQPVIPHNSKFRLPGKGASDAMITNLSIATHPGLNIIHHFRMDLPPSATLAQQSVTINLPATHYYLQIKPSIAIFMMQRQHKLFVTAGMTRLHAMPTIPGNAVEPRNPLFEARLHPGVNRIEIEIIAAIPKGTPSAIDVEIEKITIFVNLMKA